MPKFRMTSTGKMRVKDAEMPMEKSMPMEKKGMPMKKKDMPMKKEGIMKKGSCK